MQSAQQHEGTGDCASATTPQLEPREIRQRARVAQIVVAVRAGVSEPLVRLYEADPDAVRSPHKRESLDRVYTELATGTFGGP
jgi:hypothetical protein